MSARPKLAPAQLAVRRKRVEELYLRGTSQNEIARTLGISQATVSRELAYWQIVWQREHVADIDKAKLREMARIDRLEMTAWNAWEKSCRDGETIHVEETTGRVDKLGVPLPKLEKKSTTIKGQAGDPRFLERVAWCIEQRCRLMSLIIARMAHGGDPNAPPIQHDLNISLEDFRRLPLAERVRLCREEAVTPSRN